MNSNDLLRYVNTGGEKDKHIAAHWTERMQKITLLNIAVRNGNAYSAEQIFKTAVSTLGEKGENLDEIRAYFYALRSVPALILCEANDERAASLLTFCRPPSNLTGCAISARNPQHRNCGRSQSERAIKKAWLLTSMSISAIRTCMLYTWLTSTTYPPNRQAAFCENTQVTASRTTLIISECRKRQSF